MCVRSFLSCSALAHLFLQKFHCGLKGAGALGSRFSKDWKEKVLILLFPQMEVQRQQLQAAVDQMEAALKDPLKGPDNVNIYKQYWDQYSGSLEALSKENPMMHHLLQVA